MTDEKINQRRTLRGIMLVLAAWFVFLALGAFLFGLDHETRQIKFMINPLRGLIVLACAVVFLGVWNLLLLRRKS